MTSIRLLIPILCLLSLPSSGETARDEIDAASGILRDSGISGVGKRAVIPFEERLFDGFIVKAQINGKPVTLVVDTGASATVLTIQAAERIGVKLGEFGSITDAGGKRLRVRCALIGRLTLGNAWVEKDPVIISDIPEEMRKNVDGVLGVASLANWDVRIDPEAKTITLFPSGESDELAGETIVPLTCVADYPTGESPDLKHARSIALSVPIKVGKQMLQVTPDTGDGGILSLTVKSMEDAYSSLIKQTPDTPSAYIASGIMSGKDIEITDVIFGSDTVKRVSASIFAPPSDLADKRSGQIGLGWLRHYVMTFRFAKGELKIKPIGILGEMTTSSVTGISFFSDFKIFRVEPNGPGEKAGLLVGDRLVEIEDRRIETMEVSDFIAIKRRPPGTKIKIRYQRNNDALRETVLVLGKK